MYNIEVGTLLIYFINKQDDKIVQAVHGERFIIYTCLIIILFTQVYYGVNTNSMEV